MANARRASAIMPMTRRGPAPIGSNANPPKQTAKKPMTKGSDLAALSSICIPRRYYDRRQTTSAMSSWRPPVGSSTARHQGIGDRVQRRFAQAAVMRPVEA